jgi:Glycosyltransferase family 87
MDPPRLRLVEGGPAAAPSLPHAFEFAALGIGVVLASMAIASLPDALHELGRFQLLTLIAFVFYGLALARLDRYARLPHVGLVVFVVALASRAALVPAPPSLSGDIHRYQWEGRVLAHGGDPWRHAPDDPALAPLRDRVGWPRINHPHLAAIYPPLAVAGFALVTRVSDTVRAMKTWIALHDLVLVAVLLAWLARSGRSPVAALAYAWNPLVLVEYAGMGHNDPTALLPLALAFAWRDKRPTASALAFAAAVLTKLAPLLALPFLLRAWPWRARLAAAAVLVPGLAWFVLATRGANSGLTAYGSSWRNNESLFAVLERLTGGDMGARIAGVIVIAIAAAWAWRRALAPERATRVLAQVATLVTPVLHPWYLGWVLLYEPLRTSWPWIVLSCTAFLNYGVFAPPREGGAFHLSPAWRAVEYGVPAVVAIVLAVRARARPREVA